MVSIPFPDRLYWNTRRFRRGRSPYELLGLGLPSYDFWAIIQDHSQPPSPA